MPGPCVLFSTPGMLFAGFALEAFRRWAGDEKNLVLLPSYCSPSTVGAQLLAGRRQVRLPAMSAASGKRPRDASGTALGNSGGRQPDSSTGPPAALPNDGDAGEGSTLNVRCRVNTISFAAHADAAGLHWLVHRLQPSSIMLVHGDRPKVAAFHRSILRTHGLPAHAPENGDRVSVPAELTVRLMIDSVLLRRGRAREAREEGEVEEQMSTARATHEDVPPPAAPFPPWEMAPEEAVMAAATASRGGARVMESEAFAGDADDRLESSVEGGVDVWQAGIVDAEAEDNSESDQAPAPKRPRQSAASADTRAYDDTREFGNILANVLGASPSANDAAIPTRSELHISGVIVVRPSPPQITVPPLSLPLSWGGGGSALSANARGLCDGSGTLPDHSAASLTAVLAACAKSGINKSASGAGATPFQQGPSGKPHGATPRIELTSPRAAAASIGMPPHVLRSVVPIPLPARISQVVDKAVAERVPMRTAAMVAVWEELRGAVVATIGAGADGKSPSAWASRLRLDAAADEIRLDGASLRLLWGRLEMRGATEGLLMEWRHDERRVAEAVLHALR